MARGSHSRHSRSVGMKKALALALILGFLFVDFLFFHDVLKPGEVVTFPQYLTGVLSIPVVLISAYFLLRASGRLQNTGWPSARMSVTPTRSVTWSKGPCGSSAAWTSRSTTRPGEAFRRHPW